MLAKLINLLNVNCLREPTALVQCSLLTRGNARVSSLRSVSATIGAVNVLRLSGHHGVPDLVLGAQRLQLLLCLLDLLHGRHARKQLDNLLNAARRGHRVVQLLDVQLVRQIVGRAVGILLDRCEAADHRLRLAPVRTILVLILHLVLLLGVHVHGEASHLLLHLVHELVLHHVRIELILLLVLVVLHRLLSLLLLQHQHVEVRVHEHVLATKGRHATWLHHHLAADVVAAELTVGRAIHVVHVAELAGSRAHLHGLLHLLVHVLHAVLVLLAVVIVVVVSLATLATILTTSIVVHAQFTGAVRIRALVAVATVTVLLEVPAGHRLVVSLDCRS